MDRVRKELEMSIDSLEDIVEDAIEDTIEDECEEEDEWDDEEKPRDPLSSVNTPITSSPLYPRIFVGDSAKPLQGQYPNSEYVDDNIHTTWQGLMSFYG